MLVHHRVTWFIYYKVTRSITTPPLDGMLHTVVHHRVTWFVYYEVTVVLKSHQGKPQRLKRKLYSEHTQYTFARRFLTPSHSLHILDVLVNKHATAVLIHYIPLFLR